MDEELEEVVSNKFKALIQPIKDLASNWDIDIADSLSDYLDDLAKLSFSLNDEELDSDDEVEDHRDDHKKLNFAEAALLIQGSTMIYSKKVEYLYQLVLKSLEAITNKKSTILKEPTNEEEASKNQPTQATKGRKGPQKFSDSEFFNMSMSNVEYLLLDDVIEEGKNITVEPKYDDQSFDLGRSRMSLNGSLHNLSHISTLSQANISVMTSFIMGDKAGRNEFRLTSNDLNVDGSLRVPGLDPINVAQVMSSTAKKRMSVSFADRSRMELDDTRLAAGEEKMMVDTPIAGGNPANAMGMGDGPAGADDYYDDGGGNDFYDYSDRLTQEKTSATPVRPAQELHGDSLVHLPFDLNPATTSESRQNSASKRSRQNNSSAVPTADENIAGKDNSSNSKNTKFYSKVPTDPLGLPVIVDKPISDLYDLHTVIPGSRAIRKGRPYQIMKKNKLTDDEQFLNFLNETKNPSSSSSKNTNNGDDLYIGFLHPFAEKQKKDQNPLFFESLLPLLKLKYSLDRKKRLQNARENKKNGKTQEEEERFHNLFEAPTKNVEVKDIPAELDFIYGNDADDDVDGGDIGGGFDGMGAAGGMEDYYEPGGMDGGDGMIPIVGPGINGDLDNDVPTADELFDANEEEELTKRVEAALKEDIIQAGNNAYQNICKQYLEGFHWNNTQYAKESQLIKRVNEWTMRIEPILEAQEEMKPFDIHEYSDVILDSANHIVEEKRKSLSINQSNLTQEDYKVQSTLVDQITFSEMVKGKSTSDVCRMFLSCLQLTNAGNLEIIKENDLNKQELFNLLNHREGEEDQENKQTKSTRNKRNNQKDKLEKSSQQQQLLHHHHPTGDYTNFNLPEVGNDVLFKVKSTNRTKVFEEFRAPSVETHSHHHHNHHQKR